MSRAYNERKSQALIILGGKASSRYEKIKEIYNRIKPGRKLESDPDVYFLQSSTSIKIAEVRELEKSLHLKPYEAPPKIAIIEGAEKLTFEAQGALLKLLEEPPGETTLILTTQDENNLLPTIISRCQQIYLPPEAEMTLGEKDYEEIKDFVGEIMKASTGERVRLAEKITSREEAILFCQKQTLFWEKVLLEKPNIKIAKVLRHIQKTLKYLSANVNPRLAIENLLLSYP